MSMGNWYLEWVYLYLIIPDFFLEHLAEDHKESKPISLPVNPKTQSSEIPDEVAGFCDKCLRVRVIRNPLHVILDMRHAIQGICPVCGGKITVIIKSKSDIDEDMVPHQMKTKKEGKQKK